MKIAKRKGKKRRFFRKRASRRKSTPIKAVQMEAIAYGAVRKFLSQLVSPVTEKVPMGQFADEAVVGASNYLIAKNSSGMIKKVAMKGLIVENALIGSEITRTVQLPNFGFSAAKNNNSGQFLR